MESRTANMAFRLEWNSAVASHAERLYVPRVDFWRDIFPRRLEQGIASLAEGETLSDSFDPGDLVPMRDQSLVRSIRDADFQRRLSMQSVEPRVGRYYPRTLIPGVAGIFAGDFRPFRVLDMDGEHMTLDLNHPLAGRKLHLGVTVVEDLPPRDQRGGSCHDIAEMVTEKGPGMEALDMERSTDFFDACPLPRLDDNPDGIFYQMPRLVEHVDAVASREIGGIYRRLLQPGQRVLDLMSSWVSHLPGELDLEVSGLGLNEEELQKNSRLSERKVQDLNRNPALPYADASFDAVVCANSVEYLVHPIEMFGEVARVLRPGGLAVFVFSERWFPPKVITLWTELHPFERLGYVLETFRQCGGFQDLNTESVRGFLRPDDDKYRGMTPYADPVYAVWARRGR